MADDRITRLRNAAQSVSGHRRVLENTLELYKLAEELALDEQLVRDLEQRRDIAKRDADQQYERLREIEKKVDKTKLDVKAAEAQAKKVVDDALARSGEIKNLAKAEGAKLVADISAKKEQLYNAVARLEQQLIDLRKELGEKGKLLEETVARIAEEKRKAIEALSR